MFQFPSGEDISICVVLAIMTSLFDDNGKCNNKYENYNQYIFSSLAKLVHKEFSLFLVCIRA